MDKVLGYMLMGAMLAIPLWGLYTTARDIHEWIFGHKSDKM